MLVVWVLHVMFFDTRAPTRGELPAKVLKPDRVGEQFGSCRRITSGGFVVIATYCCRDPLFWRYPRQFHCQTTICGWLRDAIIIVRGRGWA